MPTGTRRLAIPQHRLIHLQCGPEEAATKRSMRCQIRRTSEQALAANALLTSPPSPAASRYLPPRPAAPVVPACDEPITAPGSDPAPPLVEPSAPAPPRLRTGVIALERQRGEAAEAPDPPDAGCPGVRLSGAGGRGRILPAGFARGIGRRLAARAAGADPRRRAPGADGRPGRVPLAAAVAGVIVASAHSPGRRCATWKIRASPADCSANGSPRSSTIARCPREDTAAAMEAAGAAFSWRAGRVREVARQPRWVGKVFGPPPRRTMTGRTA